MRWWAALLAVAAVAGCGVDETRPVAAQAPIPFRSDEHGFAGQLPARWELASQSLTPRLSNPVEILSAGTVRVAYPNEGTCGKLPVGAIERMGPQDVFVTVQERHGEARFPDRPARFTLPREVENGDAAACARDEPPLDEYWFQFRDAGRNFYVDVVLGQEAPPERREEALALLDSLRFEPGPLGVHVDPDLAVHFSDKAIGLSWVMPVPPWRRYESRPWVPSERLMLGTFDWERPPAWHCAPQAAIDAMPPDGAFIYLFEYVDLAERWMQRIPERAGELVLGPETAFECFGESRMATWQEHGRAFQAHVYIGPSASDELKRDVQSILNSIRAG